MQSLVMKLIEKSMEGFDLVALQAATYRIPLRKTSSEEMEVLIDAMVRLAAIRKILEEMNRGNLAPR